MDFFTAYNWGLNTEDEMAKTEAKSQLITPLARNIPRIFGGGNDVLRKCYLTDRQYLAFYQKPQKAESTCTHSRGEEMVWEVGK